MNQKNTLLWNDSASEQSTWALAPSPIMQVQALQMINFKTRVLIASTNTVVDDGFVGNDVINL